MGERKNAVDGSEELNMRILNSGSCTWIRASGSCQVEQGKGTAMAGDHPLTAIDLEIHVAHSLKSTEIFRNHPRSGVKTTKLGSLDSENHQTCGFPSLGAVPSTVILPRSVCCVGVLLGSTDVSLEGSEVPPCPYFCARWLGVLKAIHAPVSKREVL